MRFNSTERMVFGSTWGSLLFGAFLLYTGLWKVLLAFGGLMILFVVKMIDIFFGTELSPAIMN